MIQIYQFSFNPFQENTYVLADKTGACIVIDPGCYDESERMELTGFIKSNKLKPVRLINTHCHIDHVFGNKFISETYKLDLEINEHDLKTLDSLLDVAHVYNLNVEKSPAPKKFLKEGETIEWGNSKLEILFTPGHSPGSLCFVNHEQKFVIGGDVLFYGSIGRTDLPGGNHETLLKNIRKKLFPLGDDYTVYSGHGPSTTIGYERKYNPFVGEMVTA